MSKLKNFQEEFSLDDIEIARDVNRYDMIICLILGGLCFAAIGTYYREGKDTT